jgi:predicted O-linked N-acetylglucosamine transferase (SPINDLY family)
MGSNFHDYILADLTIIPKNNRKYYSEKVAYLSNYQANDSKRIYPEIDIKRKDIGLPESGFVFCCFNNTYKITPEIFDSWARILNAVKGSVMLIYVDNEAAKNNLKREILSRRVDSSRLFFEGRLPFSEYLARYRLVDLFLDTYPYNAGTTASDALWMGLPVLTLSGNSFSSRMAASLLNAVNIPELITNSQSKYEAKAIELATNSKKINSIKENLANKIDSTPLFDSVKFTKNLESLYFKMFERHSNRLEPDDIYSQN